MNSNNSQKQINRMFYFVGFLFITAIYYYFIARHSGYIYFWDASGAFSYRDPWQQYITTYSPYDGVEVGIKNRLPIVSIIWIITKILTLFGLPEGEWAIKVAIWLMLVGAYSSFYYLFPKWRAVFNLEDIHLKSRSDTYISTFIRLLTALLYVFVPFYVYRMVHLHLFFLTTFFPLIIYYFLLFTKQDNQNWKKSIFLFILMCFFGLATPHSIVYIFITLAFLVFSIFLREKTRLSLVFSRVILAGIGVLITNLYWLIPYFMEGSPSPGYVVNENMYDFLGNSTSIINFIFGTSEWYLYQSPILSGFFNKGNILTIFQYLGGIIFVTFPFYILLRTMKNKKYQLIPIFILLILIAGFVVNSSPLQPLIKEYILFSRFGWVIREPNRLKFIWSFWIFLFFTLEFHRYIFSILIQMRKRIIISQIALLTISLFSVLLYFFPRAFVMFSYFTPQKISEEHKEMEQVFITERNMKNNVWGGVLVYPREEGIALNWKNESFPIADEGDYVFFPYNLAIPSVRESSVLASGRSVADSIGQGYLAGQLDIKSDTLVNYGIEYVLIVKNPRNVYPYLPDLSDNIETATKIISKDVGFEKIFDNTDYSVYKNTHTQPLMENINPVYASDLRVLEYLNPETRVVFSLDKNVTDSMSKINFSDRKFSYLDYYSTQKINVQRFGYYDSIRTRGNYIPWGRMSLQDKTNGESYIIFRNANLYVPEYSQFDEIIYSDILLSDTNYNVPEMPFYINNECSSCTVYVKLLYSPKGGKVRLTFNGQSRIINFRSNIAMYKWVGIGTTDIGITKQSLKIKPISGFFSLADAIIISKEDEHKLIAWWNSQSKVSIDRDINNTTEIDQLENCAITDSKRDDILGFSQYKVDGSCRSFASNIRFANWDGNSFLYKPLNGKWKFVDATSNTLISDGEILLITKSNVVLFILFPLIYILMFFCVIVSQLVRKSE